MLLAIDAVQAILRYPSGCRPLAVIRPVGCVDETKLNVLLMRISNPTFQDSGSGVGIFGDQVGQLVA